MMIKQFPEYEKWLARYAAKTKHEILASPDKPETPLPTTHPEWEWRSIFSWASWKWIRGNDGEWKKIPYSIIPFAPVGVTWNIDWWNYVGAARRLHPKLPDDKRADGLAFIFRKNHGFTGVDLDDAIDPKTGAVKDWAMEIVQQLDSYTEFSPTFTGLKIYLRGPMPEGFGHKFKDAAAGIELECYSHSRYFTYSGMHLEGTPLTWNLRTAEIAAFAEKYLKRRVTPKPIRQAREIASNQSPSRFSDSDTNILDLALRNDKFYRLWCGDLSGHNNDHSAADLALCFKLAWWTARDHVRIDSLFRQSGLYREKWDEARGEWTYGERTIALACEKTTGHFGDDDDGIRILFGSRPGTISVANKVNANAVLNCDRHCNCSDCRATREAAPGGFRRRGLQRNPDKCGKIKSFVHQTTGKFKYRKTDCDSWCGCDFCRGKKQEQAWKHVANLIMSKSGADPAAPRWHLWNRPMDELKTAQAAIRRAGGNYCAIQQVDGYAWMVSDVQTKNSAPADRDAALVGLKAAITHIPYFAAKTFKKDKTRARPVRLSKAWKPLPREKYGYTAVPGNAGRDMAKAKKYAAACGLIECFTPAAAAGSTSKVRGSANYQMPAKYAPHYLQAAKNLIESIETDMMPMGGDLLNGMIEICFKPSDKREEKDSLGLNRTDDRAGAASTTKTDVETADELASTFRINLRT